MKTAILVDGGFYRRRAQKVFGDISAQDRAIELATYCKRHLNTHGEANTNTSMGYALATKLILNFQRACKHLLVHKFLIFA